MITRTIPSKLKYTALICLAAVLALLLLPLVAPLNGDPGPDFFTFLGRFHIVVLHLPIAWLVMVPVLEYLGDRRGIVACKVTARYALMLAALAAVVTVLFGFTLASSDGYAGQLVTYHMWAGIITAVTVILALLCKEVSLSLNDRPASYAYAVFLSASLVAVAIGGHLGGTLVQGEGYLTAKAPHFLKTVLGVDSEGADPVVSRDAPIYTSIIQPIFKEHCVRCHGAAKLKGGFRVDILEGLLKGGKSGKHAVLPGSVADSELFRRINLPRHHKQAMPPKKHDGLAQPEKDLIGWWITIGSPPESAIDDLPPENVPQEIALLIDDLMTTTDVAVAKVEAIEPALFLEQSQRLLNEHGIKVYPVSQNPGDGLQVITRNMRTPVDESAIIALLPLAPYIVSMDLSGAVVGTDVIQHLGKFASLEQLKLNNSPVRNADLQYLSGLAKLRHLNLLGTDVTDAATETLGTFVSLKSLNLYLTGVTASAGAVLQKQMPGCRVMSVLQADPAGEP